MEGRGYRGWDPFDALNSPFLAGLARRRRWAGIAALQLVKGCPVNLRPILRIPQLLNAKGVGLVLAASVRRYGLWREERDLARARSLAGWLAANVTGGYRGAGWGYPFDWPNRAFFAPRGTPTVVNTAFIGHALLDLYEMTGESRWLSQTLAAGEFIFRDLHRSPGKAGFCFSYTPLDSSRVHNANLLGASLLARAGKETGLREWLDAARESASFSIQAQRPDGSWPYGEAANQSWVDSFHTGYNLVALRQVGKVLDEPAIEKAITQGYRYYLDHFFLPAGVVKFWAQNAEPLEAHAFSHAVICLKEMESHPETPPDLADEVMASMIALFWSRKGFFYWQRRNGILYRTPFMRWVQAWALLALTCYLGDR
jgi:hypothetical protein